jgi:PAS domain S-box-containing protein
VNEVHANELLEETAEDLYENAPCGYLSCRADGTIARVNRTFEHWTGHGRSELVGRRFVELLSPPDRVYHETHYAPLLRMQGSVREIAVSILRADGSRMPALVNSVQRTDESGRPTFIRTTVFDATDRRRYEQELLRARRREQAIAQELQRGLLSGRLPTSPQLEIDVFYRPAIADLEVGGDWYDAFALDERRVALVIGDVVGRGITAATTMGQLRSAVRALGATGLAPGPLLDALDRYTARHEVGSMTTLVYAEVDLATLVVRYASAGHPPPLLVEADGSARFLEDGRSVPLDVPRAAGVGRDQGQTQVRPGAQLVLYTDGLVERRHRSIADGMELLRAAIRRLSGPRPLEELVHALEDPGHVDDVCVLGARLPVRDDLAA